MKRIDKLLGILIFIGALFLMPTFGEAAPRPLTQLGYFHWANQSKTAADSTFVMHYGEKTTVEPLEGEFHGGYISVNRQTNVSSVLLKNVGVYEGKEVNLKVTIERNKSNLNGGDISFTKSYFLGIDISGEMVVTYEFFDKKNQPLTVKTAFNYYGLNTNKYIGYRNPGQILDDLYANNPTHILYDTWNGNGDDQWLYLKNITPGIPWRDPRQSFEVVTKPVQKLTYVVHNNDSTPSSIVYRTDFLAEPEFPAAYALEQTCERADQDVSLKAQQTMPNVEQWKAANSIQLLFNLEKVRQTKQYELGEVKIKNYGGQDVTELFEHKLDEAGNLLLTAKDPTDSRLYDTVLEYEVGLKWQGRQQPVDVNLISEDRLALPFSVQTKINDEQPIEKAGTTQVNYLGKVTVAFLDEQDNLLNIPNVIKQGILTTPFDSCAEYPKVEGYFPLKNEQEDHGIFLPEDQTIYHRYRKGKPLQFELKNNEEPLYVSRFTNQRIIPFTFSQEASATISVLAKCGQDERQLKSYQNPADKVEGELHFQAPKEWLNKKVSFYIKDDKGQNSNEEIRTIVPEIGPQYTVPNTITFAERSIPAMELTVAADTKEVLKVEDNSRLDQSNWKVQIRETQPLTDVQGNQLSKRFVFMNKNEQTNINDEDQLIWQGSGSAQLSLKDALKLKLKPTDKIGKYKGTLKWTFVDAPS
jgi:hypothetical protein